MRTCMPQWHVSVTVAFLVFAATVLVPATASRAETPNVPPLPSAVAPPPTGKAVIFQGQGSGLLSLGGSLDEAKFGYVLEEFLVSGKANVYRYGADGKTHEIQTADVPYTTRIVVRRPQDRKRFSGTVWVETAHPQVAGSMFPWSADYHLTRGDAHVNITTRRTSNGTSGPDTLKAFDAVRYAPINFTEDGLTWDIVGQVGRLLKTRTAANPLNGYDVKRMYAHGWSGGGALLLLYISDGFHERVRMPGGGPIFDGYIVGEPSGYPKINSTATPIPNTDPRQKVQPRDVPAITLHTHLQEQYRRRPDGDQKNDRYRVYEVAGAGHGNRRIPRIYNQPEDAFLKGSTVRAGAAGPSGEGQPMKCGEISRFPFTHIVKSTYARLDAWATKGATPPPSQRITLQPDGKPMLDKHGNPLGGVRTTYADVPTARHFGDCQESFSSDTLKSLYPDEDRYVKDVLRRVDQLQRSGWLLRADADELRQEARKGP